MQYNSVEKMKNYAIWRHDPQGYPISGFDTKHYRSSFFLYIILKYINRKLWNNFNGGIVWLFNSLKLQMAMNKPKGSMIDIDTIVSMATSRGCMISRRAHDMMPTNHGCTIYIWKHISWTRMWSTINIKTT